METTPTPTESKQKTTMRKALLVLNCILLIIGNCGGPLITRLYYVSGGKLIWLQSCLQTAAFPLLLPLTASYLHRGCNNLVLIKHRLLITAAVVGILTGLDNYFFAYGLAYLPVSTSTLIIGTQLAFTATFAFFLVKQKFVFHSTNSVVLLTVAAVVLALRSSGDRPEGVTSREYVRGFMMTVAAAALYGLILPLVELSYMKGKQRISYALVLEMQFVICILATSFCSVGMLINKDFQAIPSEAREFKLGEVKYYIVVVFSAIVWQGYFLGAIGIVFCSSSLLSGIVIAGTLPLTEFLAVAFYREKFQPEKGVALALALWGFASYFYGELKRNKTQLQINTETELPQVLNSRVTIK